MQSVVSECEDYNRDGAVRGCDTDEDKVPQDLTTQIKKIGKCFRKRVMSKSRVKTVRIRPKGVVSK